jgi:signal peptidase complex subunit 3
VHFHTPKVDRPTIMHNVWVRLNAVFFFSLTVLLAMSILCALSTIGHDGNPVVNKLKLNTLRSLRNHGGIDRALFTFDLDADFTPAFHWNIHQLNVFVVAEYESKKNTLNQLILWDTIIENKADARLKLKDEFVKFGLVDQGNELRNRTVSLKVMWDNMPLTGQLWTEKETKSHPLKLPSKYKN